MQTYQDYKKLPPPQGYRGPLRKGEFYFPPEMWLEDTLQNCAFIMNRRNIRTGYEPQPVDLCGQETNPMDPSKTMSWQNARDIFQIDGLSTYDGVSLVLPSIPSPIKSIDGIDYYLVAGLFKNCIEHKKIWDPKYHQFDYELNLSSAFQADMISLGNPLWGISPTQKSAYFFGLSQKPVETLKNKDKTIFSYAGCIAIGITNQPDYRLTGIDKDVSILSPKALKVIEKWRQEAV